MKKTVFQDRLSILRQGLTSGSPDTLWIVQPENRRYLSGFKASDTQLNESSGSLLINKKRAILITDSRYTIEAQEQARDFEIITLKKDLDTELCRLLGQIKTRVLGFEGDHLTWEQHRRFSKQIKKLKSPVRMTPMDGSIGRMREVKDREELKSMKAAADIMSAVLDEVLHGLRPGRTEIEVAREIEELARDAGAEGMAFPPIVASGPNAALPHATPSQRRIGPRDPIIFDIGARLNGYCSDMTRTVFLEPPVPMFKKIYGIVRRAQLAALEYVRPGEKSTKADSIARDIIRQAGFGDYFGHSLGHSVGLATHETPRLSPKNPVTLEEGMVVTVEPGIYIPGKGGVRLEEMVVIERHGPRILTENDNYYDF
ncbi:MAG: aminopeptidase P family protein [Deltaproteobacteria bacterium]|nr:aminopeptidase P family protein [Deltaproteobacteria bacterium]